MLAEHLLSTEHGTFPQPNHFLGQPDGLPMDGNLAPSSPSATAFHSPQPGVLGMIPRLPKTTTTGLFRIGLAAPDARASRIQEIRTTMLRLSASPCPLRLMLPFLLRIIVRAGILPTCNAS